MEDAYRGVFSWPSHTWIQAVQTKQPYQPCPADLGLELVQDDVITELSAMVAMATERKSDASMIVLDLTTPVDRYRLWHKCFPLVRPFYALKVCDDPAIVSLLAHLGAGFDCASQTEVNLVLSLGIDPANIIYANTVKFPSQLTYAVNNNVTLMTFDNENELFKIKQLAPEARLVLRMAPVENVGNVEWQLNNKFGCSHQRATELFQTAQNLGLQVIGVSFHVGSGCSDAQTYIKNIEAARVIFNIAQKVGFQLKLLDIGGGLYGDAGSEAKLQKMCGAINATLEAMFPASSGVQVIAEPGRYFVESAATLATCVIGKRTPDPGVSHQKTVPTEKSNKQEKMQINKTNLEHQVEFEYYISESAFGILNMNLFGKGHNYRILPLKPRPLEEATHISRLWGPTCDSIDIVQECCHLVELEEGDWLVFPDVGAYTLTVASTFNGMPKCPVRRVMRQDVWEGLFSRSTPAQEPGASLNQRMP